MANRVGSHLIVLTWMTMGLAKLLAPDDVAASLIAFRLGLSDVLMRWTYTLLAVIEVACGIAVLIPRVAPWGLSCSFWLAATLGLAHLILPFDSEHCGCLGKLAAPSRGLALAIVGGLVSVSAYLRVVSRGRSRLE